MRLKAANEHEPSASGGKKAAIVAAKLAVTGACFWYLSWQIDLTQVLSPIPPLKPGWFALATLLVMVQIGFVAARWREILHVIRGIDQRVTGAAIFSITAIGVFFSQILPSPMGEGIRAWLVVRRGCDWRSAVSSVLIDRGVGVALLIALGFAILLLPAGRSALGTYRDLVLMLYGALLVCGITVLLLLPKLVVLIERAQYLRWVAALAMSARRVVLGPRSFSVLGLGCVIHSLTIAAIWALGRAQGLLLPVPEAAVLFVVVVGVALVPVSINGWGLRELAVVAMLGSHGVPPQQALVFSVWFGLTMAIGSLPGALAWLAYSLAPAKRPSEPTAAGNGALTAASHKG
jgi:uncharacterized membrane protein YbhN (UPF0104 family)